MQLYKCNFLQKENHSSKNHSHDKRNRTSRAARRASKLRRLGSSGRQVNSRESSRCCALVESQDASCAADRVWSDRCGCRDNHDRLIHSSRAARGGGRVGVCLRDSSFGGSDGAHGRVVDDGVGCHLADLRGAVGHGWGAGGDGVD